jgi:hypothetical protein
MRGSSSRLANDEPRACSAADARAQQQLLKAAPHGQQQRAGARLARQPPSAVGGRAGATTAAVVGLQTMMWCEVQHCASTAACLAGWGWRKGGQVRLSLCHTGPSAGLAPSIVPQAAIKIQWHGPRKHATLQRSAHSSGVDISSGSGLAMSACSLKPNANASVISRGIEMRWSSERA